MISDKVDLIDSAGNKVFVSIDDIAEGEAVMTIPAHLHITQRKVAENAIPRFHQNSFSWGAVPVAAHYVRKVEQRAVDLAAGNPDTDPWGLYWDSVNLSAVDGALMFWPEEELESLGRSEAYEVFQQKRDFTELYEKIAGATDAGAVGPLDARQFFRALLWVDSRHFGDYSVNVVPVGELFNHNSGLLSNLDFEFHPSEDSPQHLQFTAKRDIRRDEEMTITYGDHSNAKLLRQYSFTMTPLQEPTFSFRVLTRHIAEDLLPDFEFEEFGEHLELMTTTVRLEEGDDEQYTAFHDAIASISGFVAEVGLATFERVLSFYASQLERDKALGPFVAQLQKNRETNPSSHVWWADQAQADRVDASAASAVGSQSRSDAIRSKMGQLLCLTAHIETLRVLRGEILAEAALIEVEVLRDHLAKALNLALTATARDDL